MTEHKSPPGPREMVQEHKTINTYSLPAFHDEGEPVGGGDPETEAQETAGVAFSNSGQVSVF